MGIVCHCPPLGRPKKNPDPEEEKLRRKASGERNGVEATFGTAKRVYRANNIRAKLKETAQTWIGACFFAKNLKKFLMGLLWENSSDCSKFTILLLLMAIGGNHVQYKENSE